MGLGRKRARSELLEAVRAELDTTRSEMRAALADVLAQLDERLQTRLEAREHAATGALAQLGDVGSQLGARVAEFERALDRVGQTCDLAVQTVQLNRAERMALLDAVADLAERLPDRLDAGPAADPPERPGGLKVVGGHVEAGAAPAPEPSESTPARELPPEHPAVSGHVIRLDGVEVRCRFDGDHWVGGFEVADVVRDGEGIRYRLRRRADGYELPRLFSARDVRDVDPPHLREVPRPH